MTKRDAKIMALGLASYEIEAMSQNNLGIDENQQEKVAKAMRLIAKELETRMDRLIDKGWNKSCI